MTTIEELRFWKAGTAGKLSEFLENAATELEALTKERDELKESLKYTNASLLIRDDQLTTAHLDNERLRKAGKSMLAASIPENWTFKDDGVALAFDNHVREQLPWYDIATRAVVHLGRHYIPRGGMVYDIGASTGNITRALAPTCKDRGATIYAIEESAPMREMFALSQPDCEFFFLTEDALKYEFKMFDFAVCFLTFMFFPVAERRAWFLKIRTLIKPGGAFVLVDKISTPPGYVGTALRRMAMQWKIESGTSSEDVVKKELSLAGYQRPLDPKSYHPELGQQFFQMGEFAGWVMERSE